MNRNLLFSLIFGMASLAPAMSVGEVKVRDMGDAVEFCNRQEIDKIEGVWEFPEDQTTVFIRRTHPSNRDYELILISSPDCRVEPGDRIGVLTPSADANRYQLSLSLKRDYGMLASASNCSAEFNEAKGVMYVHPMKMKLGLKLPSFLPRFWRIINVSLDDPASELPRGMRKIYPHTLSPEKIVYL